ncbi:FAD binding domain-containing protein [Altererythrobacter sp. B11]|uniref:FAD-binding oxidoreductase n=1 Tax=Altererythrobacter sp. B11 TaxID=2060312 RepID=UPI000DC7200F|nr:FAD-binding oxidoreductase [Altererythrobacter sp. B11]BBC73083.1 FAD binding domain-containing protein [Altererythrobacter sp. B11]
MTSSAEFARLAIETLCPTGAKVTISGNPEYGEVRDALSWNKRLADSRAPALIVRVSRAEQVAEALRFARAQGIRVSPRGGGHNYEARALRDDCLLLDLGGFDEIAIDAGARSAWVGAGVQGGRLIEELAQYGLGFPIGHCSDVSLSGYLLSGGFGWNSGSWGPACASVSEVELVLPSGAVLQASETVHPELFWAARGGGAGLCAVATRYRLKLHPLPQAAATWSGRFAAADAPLMADWLDRAVRGAHSSSEIACLVGPDIHTGEPAIAIRAVGMAQESGEAWRRIGSFDSPLPPARQIGAPEWEVTDFADLTKLSSMPTGKRVAADHIWSESSLGEMLLAVHHLAGIPGKSSTINLFGFGGGECVPNFAFGRDGALSVGGGNEAGIYAMWDDPIDDPLHLDWVRAANVSLAPHRDGRYVGEASLAADNGRVAECFTSEALRRLTRLRREHDPDSLLFGFES